jgi:uncharacterized protein (DUF1330 family)
MEEPPMPKAYVVARVTVTDPQAYAEYVKGASEAIRHYGGRALALTKPSKVKRARAT